MKNKSINQLIQHFLEEKKNGMDFSEIRKTLEQNGIEEDKIKIIIRDIDNKILREEQIKSNNQKARELIYIGLFFTIAGLFLTIGSYTGFIDLGNVFVLAWGPVLGGLGTMFAGYGKLRKN